MKHSIIKISFLNGLMLGLVMSLSHAQGFTEWYYSAASDHEARAEEVMQDNEHQRSLPGWGVIIYCNSILLNGKALDYEKFTSHSSGILTIVKGKSESSEAKPIPFKVSLRRNGTLLEERIAFTREGRYEIEISELLAHSHSGDQLVIEPIRKEYWMAKRILKVME